jgi:hypothetical protein
MLSWLDVAMRDSVQQRILGTGAQPSELPFQTNWAIAELATALETENTALDRRVVASYLAAMQETTDSGALSSLGRALDSLGEKLDATAAKAVAEQIVAAMQETTDYRALYSLVSALGSLGEKLDATAAKAVAEQIVAAMQETTDSFALSSFNAALESLGGRLETRDILGIMKSVVCVTKFQKGPLTALNAKAVFPADGNLWKAVDWADKQGIDIDAVQRW